MARCRGPSPEVIDRASSWWITWVAVNRLWRTATVPGRREDRWIRTQFGTHALRIVAEAAAAGKEEPCPPRRRGPLALPRDAVERRRRQVRVLAEVARERVQVDLAAERLRAPGEHRVAVASVRHEVV